MTSGSASLRELPLGAVRPTGWLRDQLQLQADGQTGQLDQIWPDVGPNSAWLGGSGEDWERGPYYVDGLLPLAHLLQDERLLAKAQTWVEAMLASQREDGQFGPPTNDDWWPRMVALKVLTQHADATDDERIAPFLERYFRFQLAHLPERPLRGWGQVRGADNVLSILWLRDRTGHAWLTDLARLVLSQTTDWHSFLTQRLPAQPAAEFDHLIHGVNIAMGLKTTAMAHLVDDNAEAYAATRAQFDNLDRLHGQVHGVFSSDEWLAGRDAARGVETCLVVELMFTLEQLARVFGDGVSGDLLELVAFNLLAASNDPHMLAHQYHQQANQVKVSVERREWTYSGDDANIFGFEPNFGCCTANLHQGWPKFARSLWMQSADGALTAVAYAPCTVSATVGQATVRLDVQTSYPFDETVRVAVGLDEATQFTMRLRIPAWATAAHLAVNGTSTPVEVDDRGYVEVNRTWHDEDQVTLTLPMAVRTVERGAGAVGVRLGPLVLAMSAGEVWHPVPGAPGLGEWEVTARRSWNHALAVDEAGGVEQWPVTRTPVGEVPFALTSAPVSVSAKSIKVPDWTMALGSSGPVPASPVRSRLPIDEIILVPYGSARIRVAEFPVGRLAES